MHPHLFAIAVVMFATTWNTSCLAVSVSMNGKTLNVTGTHHADVIEIVDLGGGHLTVNGEDFLGVKNLTIHSKAGSDEVDFAAASILSLAKIEINLGGDADIADLQLGTVVGKVRCQIEGADGSDHIKTTIGSVLPGGDALSIMNGGAGEDVIVCQKSNVMVGGQAECNSDGGLDDDIITCLAVHIAGHSSCISSGGSGDDTIFCSINSLAATGTAMCMPLGGDGNDTMTCAKVDISGQHVCFGDGGAGSDTLNWVASGTANGGDFECVMFGGTDSDDINIIVGGESGEPANFTGTVRYSVDTGPGDDFWVASVILDDASTGIFEAIDVALDSGNDTAVLGFQSLGQTLILDGSFNGGSGEDLYLGPPPQLLPIPIVNFEVGL